MFRQVSGIAVAAILITSSPLASAQFFGGGGSGCSSCGGTPSYAAAPSYSSMGSYGGNCAPVSTVTSCTPIQPVYSACYQTVPVTTYKTEKQTVEVPVYKTAYEDREITTYEPVTRQKTVEVPTVSYKTVQDNRVINRDMGRWTTNYQPIKKCKPCDVDPRPGMLGWLNRTGYSFRSAFTPNYRTSRQYVPKMMACNVATSRQVAVHGTRKMVMNETHMVAKTTTQRVAVRKLSYEKKVVAVKTPVTAYRTVPIGSALAYGGYGGSMAYGGFGSSGMAFIEDDTQTALSPEPDDEFERSRTARTFPEDGEPVRSGSRENSKTTPFHGSSSSRELEPTPHAHPHPHPKPFPDDGAKAPASWDDTRRESPRTLPQRTASRRYDAERRDSDRRVSERYHSQRRTSGRGETDRRDDKRSRPERRIVLSGWKASRTPSPQTASNEKLSIPGIVRND